MRSPLKEGYWYNTKEFLIKFCQDDPEPSPPSKETTSSNIPETTSKHSLIFLDAAISLQETFPLEPEDEDTTTLNGDDIQHHLRRMLIFQDRVHLKELETVAYRQMLVEKELKTVTSKLKKELVELKEQATYLTQLIVTNRSNLSSVLISEPDIWWLSIHRSSP